MKPRFLHLFLLGILAGLFLRDSALGQEKTGAAAILHRTVAIDNVCAWPALTLLPDGSICATIFNQPSHGKAEGDVECWVSKEGRSWQKRGVAAAHEASANRMNVAAGLANNGDLLVLASGWSLLKNDQGKVTALNEVLPLWICRSTDGGKHWTNAKDAFPKAEESHTPFIPFGSILSGSDGALRVSGYARALKTKIDSAWIFRSEDDGKTWHKQALIGADHNETALFHLGRGQWLAAARSQGKTGQRLDLFRSADDGKTWLGPQPLTEAAQHPAHLAKLHDGRLLLTYGNRIKGKYGVLAKLSGDEGKTWSSPVTLVDDALSGDCGYPASAQLKNGEVVTAYYAQGIPSHRRYHMGVVIWQAPAPGK